MKNIVLYLVGLFGCLLFFAPGVAAGESGQTSAEVLNFGSGARKPAMGGAGVASVRGAVSLHYNPAGLPRGRSSEVEFTYQELIEGINFGNLDYSQDYSRNQTGNFGVGLRYLSYGSSDRTVLDGNDNVDPDGSFSGSDFVTSLGYGRKWGGEFSWGTTLKLGRLEIDESTASFQSLDAGLQWESSSPALPLSAGFVLANLGTSVEFEQVSEDLPLLTQVGLSYDLSPQVGLPVRTNLDIEHQVESGESGVLFGMEYFYRQFFLRGGYDGRLDVDGGVTAGFGFEYSKSTAFDYAIVPYGDFGSLHKISFSYQFN